MELTPREIDKLVVYQVAELARRRRGRGTKLNISEAECMPGVRERITLLQVEATFPDGTKLVSCHDPISA